MLGPWLLLSCILGAQLRGVIADDAPCTLHSNGQYFDLNPLKSSKDWKLTSQGGRDYHINICRPVVFEAWAVKVDKPEEIAGITRRDHGDFSIGAVNTTLSAVDGSPYIRMTNGSPCSGGGDLHASTAIRFICDSSVPGFGAPQLIAELPLPDDSACAFVIEWRTPVACPTRDRLGFFAILAIIIGALAALYLICGTAYNYFVLGIRGFDVLPRVSFCTIEDTVEFCQNCAEHIRSYTSDALPSGGGWRDRGNWGSGGGGYRGLAPSREEEASMLGGPPGFLDEEDDEEAVQASAPQNAKAQGMDGSGVIRL